MARTTGSNGEETEARIRSCALSLIADHGFEAMSMRRLAAAVGVQSAALYRYFPTKQALLAELMTSHMKQLLAAWTAATPDNSAAPLARLDAFARFHIRYHLARPHEVFIAYMELRSLSPAHYLAVGTLRSTYEDVLKEILIDGSQRGDFQLDDIHVTAMAMLAMLTGVTTWYQPGGRLSAAEVEAHYTALVCRMAMTDFTDTTELPQQAAR